MTQVYDDKELIANARAKAPDVKESFECGWEENVGMPNIWLPEDVLPGFREACMDFYWVCELLISRFHDLPRTKYDFFRLAMRQSYKSSGRLL